MAELTLHKSLTFIAAWVNKYLRNTLITIWKRQAKRSIRNRENTRRDENYLVDSRYSFKFDLSYIPQSRWSSDTISFSKSWTHVACVWAAFFKYWMYSQCYEWKTYKITFLHNQMSRGFVFYSNVNIYAGTTSAVPDCSTNHDSADRIIGQFLFYHDHNLQKVRETCVFDVLYRCSSPSAFA